MLCLDSSKDHIWEFEMIFSVFNRHRVAAQLESRRYQHFYFPATSGNATCERTTVPCCMLHSLLNLNILEYSDLVYTCNIQ